MFRLSQSSLASALDILEKDLGFVLYPVIVISDHLPCFTSICISQTKTTPPKFITVNTRSETTINSFKEGLKATLLQSHFNTDSHGNPNITYDIIEKHITDAKETFLPTKIIRFNKHKHRIKSWMTENILRSIKFETNYTNSICPSH